MEITLKRTSPNTQTTIGQQVKIKVGVVEYTGTVKSLTEETMVVEVEEERRDYPTGGTCMLGDAKKLLWENSKGKILDTTPKDMVDKWNTPSQDPHTNLKEQLDKAVERGLRQWEELTKDGTKTKS